jgi:hypothetical protein
LELFVCKIRRISCSISRSKFYREHLVKFWSHLKIASITSSYKLFEYLFIYLLSSDLCLTDNFSDTYDYKNRAHTNTYIFMVKFGLIIIHSSLLYNYYSSFRGRSNDYSGHTIFWYHFHTLSENNISLNYYIVKYSVLYYI